MSDFWEVYSKILSEQDLNLVYDKFVHTAQYIPSTKTIKIPIFNFFDEETTQMMVSHEIAHAMFSNYSPEEFDYLINEYGDLFRVVEDAYVERMIRKEFGGLSSIFQNGYKRLVKEEIYYVQENEIPDYSSLT